MKDELRDETLLFLRRCIISAIAFLIKGKSMIFKMIWCKTPEELPFIGCCLCPKLWHTGQMEAE